MKKGWTKKSYDALYNWIDKTKRPQVKKILLSDGLEDVVNRLEAAQNMGEWYKITHEAVAAVGSKIVEQSANEAEKELDVMAAKCCTCLRCGYNWMPKAKAPKQCPNCKSMKWSSER
jgi:predicted Zn-ribbon and HTH transcriptional regulator